MERLSCSLFNPGTRFMVTDDVKEATFGPGTVGIMSHVKSADSDYEDVAHILVSVIKRGKGGKERLNSTALSVPIFFDKKMLDHKNYLPTGRRHYVHIEPYPFKAQDLMKINPMNFLGWATSYAKYLHFLADSIAKPKKGLWPQDGKNPLAVGIRLCDYFSNDEAETIERYGNRIEWRESFITQSRKMESALVKCSLRYKDSVVKMALNSARFVDYTNKEYYKVTGKKSAKGTIKFYEDKEKIVEEMINHRSTLEE
jgi:hypothetical protein